MWIIRQVVKTAITLSVILCTSAWAAENESTPAQTVITNVNIFNGIDGELIMGQSVLIEGNIIKQVGNYADSFDRNVGKGSALKVKRGLNALWRDGGLHYAPPID